VDMPRRVIAIFQVMKAYPPRRYFPTLSRCYHVR
jgi:hypothetical protein